MAQACFQDATRQFTPMWVVLRTYPKQVRPVGHKLHRAAVTWERTNTHVHALQPAACSVMRLVVVELLTSTDKQSIAPLEYTPAASISIEHLKPFLDIQWPWTLQVRILLFTRCRVETCTSRCLFTCSINSVQASEVQDECLGYTQRP